MKIGDKVVPIKKTVGSWGDLDGSSIWKRAQARGQSFLYITGYDASLQCWALCVGENDHLGDFFNESDLIPYQDIDAYYDAILLPDA